MAADGVGRSKTNRNNPQLHSSATPTRRCRHRRALPNAKATWPHYWARRVGRCHRPPEFRQPAHGKDICMIDQLDRRRRYAGSPGRHGRNAGGGVQVIDTLGAILTVDMAADRQHDQTFFALLKDRETVCAIFAEVIGTTAANSYLTETGTKKIDHPQSADWRWTNQGRNLNPALYVVPSGSLHGAVKGVRETSLGLIGALLMPNHCIGCTCRLDGLPVLESAKFVVRHHKCPCDAATDRPIVSGWRDRW